MGPLGTEKGPATYGHGWVVGSGTVHPVPKEAKRKGKGTVWVGALAAPAGLSGGRSSVRAWERRETRPAPGAWMHHGCPSGTQRPNRFLPWTRWWTPAIPPSGTIPPPDPPCPCSDGGSFPIPRGFETALSNRDGSPWKGNGNRPPSHPTPRSPSSRFAPETDRDPSGFDPGRERKETLFRRKTRVPIDPSEAKPRTSRHGHARRHRP